MAKDPRVNHALEDLCRCSISLSIIGKHLLACQVQGPSVRRPLRLPVATLAWKRECPMAQGGHHQIRSRADGCDVWHDRAVFHFLITIEDRVAYVLRAAKAVKAAAHVIVSTFGPEGPTKCSSLDVVCYDAESLHNEFGTRFDLLESSKELHRTPIGIGQLLSLLGGADSGPGPRPIKPTAAPAPCRRDTHRRIFAPDNAPPSR